MLARALRVPVRLLSDDSAWPDESVRFGLNDVEIRTVRGLHFLHQWYLDHTGPEAAHKFLSLDFDMLRRQTQILRSLARTFGDDALIRVFVISDYEEGRFDREFATIERLAERTPGFRKRILEYVADMPGEERYQLHRCVGVTCSNEGLIRQRGIVLDFHAGQIRHQAPSQGHLDARYLDLAVE